MASAAPPAQVWPTLVYRDARAAIRFLTECFGFVEVLVVPSPDDDTVIEHAQLSWPEGGGVMLGTADRPTSKFSQRPCGVAAAYVVTADPDAVHARAVAHAATIFDPLQDHDYGGRGFSALDPEGNIWSFGSYPGEPFGDR